MVLFQWRSLEHVPIDETHGRLPEDPENAYDYFHTAGAVPGTGFETGISVRTEAPLVAVRAIDRSGQTLGTSSAVNLRGAKTTPDAAGAGSRRRSMR